jgi:hypothetical protein
LQVCFRLPSRKYTHQKKLICISNFFTIFSGSSSFFQSSWYVNACLEKSEQIENFVKILEISAQLQNKAQPIAETYQIKLHRNEVHVLDIHSYLEV